MRRYAQLLTALGLTLLLLGCASQPATVAEGLALLDNGEDAQAFALLDRLAQAGDPQAQQAIGVMYENGQGVKKNIPQALFWFKQSATNNNPSAQYLLASMLERGAGGPAERMQARKWFARAAQNGHPYAQYRAGMMELAGSEGIPADPLKASYWFNQAAIQGDPQAQLELGRLYMRGLAGPKDTVRGYMWIDIAQGLGDDTIIQASIQAARALSPEELQTAKKMSRQCIKQNYQACDQLAR